MMYRKLNLTLVLVISFFISCTSNAQQADVSVDEFDKAIATQTIQLLDVRTAEEFSNGHIPKAMQANWNNEAEFKKRVSALNKNIPVYTYCLVGARSAAATKWLNENGFKAYNLQGGINKWKAAGKALEQPATVKQLTMQEYLQQIPVDKTVLVDFGAAWCPPCKKMDVVIKEIQQLHADKFILIKIDGGVHSDLLKQLSVQELPTFLIYKNGKITWKGEGLLKAEEIIQQL